MKKWTGSKERLENAGFPVCFETRNIIVYSNSSGELFVQSKHNNDVRLRISDRYDSLTLTAHDAHLLPSSINGLRAIDVVSRDRR